MLKDLIVNLALGTKAHPAADYALSIAETFDAHIAGMAFALKPVIPRMGIAGISVDVIKNTITENEQAAQTAIQRFEASAKKQGVSAESGSATEMLIDAAARFAKMARAFDISVVAQADPDGYSEEDLFIESALFTSGRPVVIVPCIQKTPLKLDRILCCWDGSRTASRAIADAMPLLQRAKKVDLLMVTTGKTQSQRIAGTDMAQHLARHKLNVSIEQITGADSDIANVALSYAADNKSDFLVMGGYGHSRWREFILGGATRGILASMTIPTLMSH